MDKASIIQTIVDHYQYLPAACQAKLLETSRVLQVSRGDELVRAGSYSHQVFYVAKGSARAYYLKDGKDVSDWFAFENRFICSINSYFLQVPSPHTIETLEPSWLLVLDRTIVDQLSEEYREFDRLGKRLVTETMLLLQQRIVGMQFQTAKQSYEHLLELYPNITQRVALGHIASYLGITLETLSRIRHPQYGI